MRSRRSKKPVNTGEILRLARERAIALESVRRLDHAEYVRLLREFGYEAEARLAEKFPHRVGAPTARRFR